MIFRMKFGKFDLFAPFSYVLFLYEQIINTRFKKKELFLYLIYSENVVKCIFLIFVHLAHIKIIIIIPGSQISF